MFLRINKISLLAITCVVLLSACSGKHNADILPLDKLERVLYDYHLAQVMVNDMPSSERYQKDLYFEYVYNKHGVTKAQLDSSLVYYARYPEGLSVIYANLSDKLKGELSRIDNTDTGWVKREAVSVCGDSADLWYDARILELTSSPLSNRYSFTIPTDTNFQQGDTIVWEGNVIFLNQSIDSLKHYLYMNLTVEYMNDSLVAADTLMYSSGPYHLQVNDTVEQLVKSIEGSIYLKNNEVSSRILLVSPRLMRYHREISPDTLCCDSIATSLIVHQKDSIN